MLTSFQNKLKSRHLHRFCAEISIREKSWRSKIPGLLLTEGFQIQPCPIEPSFNGPISMLRSRLHHRK